MRQLRKSEHVTILIIGSRGIGDAVIQMLLPENLARAGFAVTFMNDHVASLVERIRRYQILKFIEYQELRTLADCFHIILYDDGSPYINEMPDPLRRWIKNNGVAYRVCKSRPLHQDITPSKIAARLPKGSEDLAQYFIRFNAPFRHSFKWRSRLTMVEQIKTFLHVQIGLSSVTTDIGLRAQQQIRQQHKILIHPTSSQPGKNWGREQYLQLAEKLQANGDQPIFTVAPAERNYWLELVANRFHVPHFENLADLVDFYQDAAALIGNDSGNAHVASCLGVPTFQIFSRWRRKPGWRAGWSPGKVVIAKFPYSLSRQHWQKGLPVFSVYRKFSGWRKQLERSDSKSSQHPPLFVQNNGRR